MQPSSTHPSRPLEPVRTCGARVDLKQMPEHVAAEPGRANGHQGGWPIANGLVCSRNWSRRGDVHRSWRSGGPSEPRGARAPSGFGCPRSGFESPRAASSRRDPSGGWQLTAPPTWCCYHARDELSPLSSERRAPQVRHGVERELSTHRWRGAVAWPRAQPPAFAYRAAGVVHTVSRPCILDRPRILQVSRSPPVIGRPVL